MIAAMQSVLVLWDIDNTLLYTGGAGSIGMRRAFHALYGVEDAFSKIEFSGRTDSAIFRDAARAHGIGEDRLDREQALFLDTYVPYLEAALTETRGALMPGVAAMLDALAEREALSRTKAFQPVRAAVTGSNVSPPLPESLALLGKERTLERLRRAAA